ncbi:hypothetical protein PPTG_11028 [Phytophthora nicotianae INRA-310]|uniref:DDE-1 domain-containing protein n=1 Tax=Phytophthora nicotianae (strain INRA-310) TaxID=761204 RepID=W2Q6Z5_PHYN3|nr:hypothetical protein PPTG_11028 [Phytophthora nicotianae INRA-310]ETN08963.1 hypothetical protein PPTG_11028 [Phytophthora nicotianae INRA-310]
MDVTARLSIDGRNRGSECPSPDTEGPKVKFPVFEKQLLVVSTHNPKNAYYDKRIMLQWVKDVWTPSVTFCRLLLLDSLKVYKMGIVREQLQQAKSDWSSSEQVLLD